MRASPYDLTAYQFAMNNTGSHDFAPDKGNLGDGLLSEAIRIETLEGRRQYSQAQKDLALVAKPLRVKVIHSYEILLSALSSQ